MLGFGAIGESALGALPDRLLYTVPAHETPEGKERIRAYYEALGRFIDTFARVETIVTHTLWAYAKTSPQIAKVIFAGARIDIGSHYIKQLAEATNAPQDKRDDLAYVLQQLGIVSGVRNQILHYGASGVAEGNAMVSDALRAKGEPNVFPISPELLSDMRADLSKIIIHLAYRHLGRPMPRGEIGRTLIDAVLKHPWQYKHPTTPKTQRARAEKQQNQMRE